MSFFLVFGLTFSKIITFSSAAFVPGEDLQVSEVKYSVLHKLCTLGSSTCDPLTPGQNYMHIVRQEPEPLQDLKILSYTNANANAKIWFWYSNRWRLKVNFQGQHYDCLIKVSGNARDTKYQAYVQECYPLEAVASKN